MKDKDKLWICYKIDVKGISPDDIPEYISEVARALRCDESVQSIFIPVIDEPSDVFLIYDPKGYRNKNNKNNLKMVKEKLKNINKIKQG